MKNRNQKILFIHPEANAYRKEFFNLLNKDLDITFAFTGGHNWVEQIPEAKNWKCKNFRPYKFIGYQGEFAPGIFFELIKDYDIIVSSIITSFPTHFSFLIAKMLGKKFVLFDELWMWPGIFLAKLALPYAKFIARHSDAILAAGTKAKEYYINGLGADEKKVFICPNSAEDISKKTIDRQKLIGLKNNIKPNNEKIILYLSRVIELRNLDCLITAFSRLEKEISNIKLVIGGDGDFLEFCKSLSNMLDVNNILFLGKIKHDDTAYYYTLCDVFVLPGKIMPENSVNVESWGLTLNEVMSLGRPVVSTDSVGAAFDLISNGVNGYRVKNNNVDELAASLEKILRSDEMREKMGSASRKIIKNFTAQEQAESFTECIESVTEKY